MNDLAWAILLGLAAAGGCARIAVGRRAGRQELLSTLDAMIDGKDVLRSATSDLIRNDGMLYKEFTFSGDIGGEPYVHKVALPSPDKPWHRHELQYRGRVYRRTDRRRQDPVAFRFRRAFYAHLERELELPAG